MFQDYIPMKILKPRRSTLKLLITGLLFSTFASLMIIHLSQHRRPIDLLRFNLIFGRGSGEQIVLYNSAEGIRLDEYDYSMKYKVIPFAFVGPEWSSTANTSVCIATHTSMKRIHSLAEFLLSWRAAASVALFVSGPDVQIIEFFLGYLQFCYPEALLRASIHLIHSVERPPLESSSPDRNEYDCRVDPEKLINDLLSAAEMSPGGKNETEFIYPQNILRNTAIRMCPTEWIMTVDVDMMPQPSLHPRLQKFLALKENNNCSDCAFVLPTYEVKLPNDSTTSLGMVKRLPGTKEDLLGLIKSEAARPFHIAIFMKNQAASKLSDWEKLPPTPNDDIHVAYAVNYSFWYEPVFVAKRGFPLYEERFLGFGMTRNTQAYEMFLSGYKFKLLDNVFLTHWGLQGIKDRPEWRNKQTNANYNLFKKWLLEKTIRYDADPLDMIKKINVDQSNRKFKVTINNTTVTINNTTDKKKELKNS